MAGFSFGLEDLLAPGLSLPYKGLQSASNPGGGPGPLTTVKSAPTYEDILRTIQSIGDIPSPSETAMPRIEELLGQRSQFLEPFVQDIRQQTQANVAATQSDMMARGLTGSDIEMSGMAAAREGGLRAEGQLKGQFGLESSKMLSDFIFRAAQGDQEAEIQVLTMMAQAMGQELGSQRDMEMFMQQLRSMDKESRRAFWGQVIGGTLSGIGSAIGGRR